MDLHEIALSSMEATENMKNFVKKNGQLEEEESNLRLAASRKRYNNLTLTFKLFFISITLITVSVITVLIQSESLNDDSIHSLQLQTNNITTESFSLSLQRAALQLEHANSLIFSASDLAFNSCRPSLQAGWAQLLDAIRVNPFPKDPTDQQRVDMEIRILAAEKCIKSCLVDLATAAESSAAADQLWAEVVGAAAHLRERGDFLRSYRDKMLRKLGEMFMENMIIVCFLGFQMLFLFLLFWIIIRRSH